MRLKINNQDVEVSISHMNCEKFSKEHPELIIGSPLERGVCPKKITVAEVFYKGCVSKGISYCHNNDAFNRRRGSADALERAMERHPNLKPVDNESEKLTRKGFRGAIFEKMFRAEPSPYVQLAKMVRGKPELARRLVELGKTLT